jgi:hypothetical protein
MAVAASSTSHGTRSTQLSRGIDTLNLSPAAAVLLDPGPSASFRVSEVDLKEKSCRQL